MIKFENLLKLAGRVAIASIFLWAAWGKALDPAGVIHKINSAGIPAPGLAYSVTVAVEAFGGLLLVIGYRARFAALVLFAFLIPATWIFHFDLSSRVQTIMLLKNVAIMGGLMYVMAGGPGRFSLDKS